MYVKYNLCPQQRQMGREKKGDNYEPICLLDPDCDDKWITKREDYALTVDITWVDVHEAFEGEGNMTKQKKRGNIYLNIYIS